MAQQKERPVFKESYSKEMAKLSDTELVVSTLVGLTTMTYIVNAIVSETDRRYTDQSIDRKQKISMTILVVNKLIGAAMALTELKRRQSRVIQQPIEPLTAFNVGSRAVTISLNTYMIAKGSNISVNKKRPARKLTAIGRMYIAIIDLPPVLSLSNHVRRQFS